MKRLIVVFLLVHGIIGIGLAQGKYITKTGHIWFYGATPMENIDAHNHQAAGIIDSKTGDIIISVLMKSFEFPKALMQEHFNENYVESTKFPKGSFKGTITNMKDINLAKDGKYKATVEGDLTVHGEVKKIKTDGTIEVKDGKLMVTSKFNVAPEDFKIIIPGLVREKIAKEMEVNVDMTFDPMK
ncbi:MAG: YceI family protein [Bacteroidia bacterium]|nr:YceI family protein [Bacteroidia bacterium]